jgi:opacity protein-like surface antigen
MTIKKTNHHFFRMPLLSLFIILVPNTFLLNAHAAKQASPPPGQALIYIFRDEDPVAEATVPVMLDGHRIGETGPRTFLLATVTPGMHYLISGDKIIATLRLQCEPGETYFISQRALVGVYPVRTQLDIVDDAVGRKAIEQIQLAAAGPTAPSPQEAGEQPSHQNAIALILKGGSYRISEQVQLLLGSSSQFDAKSTGVAGAELEWRFRNGFALGAELYQFSNKIDFGTTTETKMDVQAFTVNLKRYFAIANFFYPYAGAGVGDSIAKFSGFTVARSSGFAYQAIAGIEFRIKNIGIYTEAKRLYSNTGDSTGDIAKVGGTGKSVGLSLSFGF